MAVLLVRVDVRGGAPFELTVIDAVRIAHGCAVLNTE
jgi:hypothetical protein